MTSSLYCHDSLYYFSSNVYTVDPNPIRMHCHHMATPLTTNGLCLPPPPRPSKFTPTSHTRQVESEVWALCLGLPGEHQLDIPPQHVLGTPSSFEYHPYCYIDFKEHAYIWKKTANCFAKHLPTCGTEYFMDFGFTSTKDYTLPNKTRDNIVQPYNGFSAHLLIVDGASCWVRAFLIISKKPPFTSCVHSLRNLVGAMGSFA
jgi:hypothetical protein